MPEQPKRVFLQPESVVSTVRFGFDGEKLTGEIENTKEGRDESIDLGDDADSDSTGGDSLGH